MGIRFWRGAALMVVGLALAGCGQSGTPAADEATTSTAPPSATPSRTALPTPTAEAAAPAAAEDVTVELLDAGGEPRQVLHLDPEAGSTGSLEMRMQMGTTVLLDGEPAQRVDLPAFVVGMSATVDEVTADTIRLSYGYDDARLDGPDPGGVEQALGALEGLTGTLTTTRSGAFVDGDVQVPDDMAATMASTMDQFEQQLASMTVPLPTEPVGPGARWRVTTAFGLNGLETQNVGTYELQSLQDGTYELAVDLEQRMVPGTIDQPGLTIEVVEGGGIGRGTVTGSLDFPLAVDGRTQMDSTMTAEFIDGGQTRRMEQQLSMVVELTPR